MVWELWSYEVGGPSYVGLKPQKVKEVKEAWKEEIIIWMVKKSDKVKE